MFKELIKYYLSEFNRVGEPAIKIICSLTVPSILFLEEYKKISPIELLPDDEKNDLKKYVIEMFPEKTVSELMDAAKIVHTIGTLL